MFLKISLLALINFCSSLYESDPRIKQLTEENYDSFLEKQEGPIVITVYSPFCKECENAASRLARIAEEFHEVVTFGSINFDIENELVQRLDVKDHHVHYVVKKNRRLKRLEGPLSKDNLIDLNLYDIIQKLESSNKGTTLPKYIEYVTVLSDGSFDLLVSKSQDIWLVLFYDSTSLESIHILPIWIKAANLIKNQVKFGLLDIKKNPETASHYMVEKFSTGVLISNEMEYFLHHNDYLTPDYIKNWVDTKISEYKDEANIKQLINQYIYDKCLTKNICIIFILPHILDCQKICRENHLDVIEKLNQKFKEFDWGWLWTESGAQTNLEKALKIDDDTKLPLTGVVNVETNKYFIIRGRFQLQDIGNSLQNVFDNQTFANEFKREIKIFDTDQWDGQDREKNHLDFFGVDILNKKDEL